MAETRQKPAGGLSVSTLVVSSLAAVVATLVVSQFWEQGTLIFTAMVPVVVAITSELLKRPAEKITAVAPKVVPLATTRRSAGATEVREPGREEPVAEPEPEPEQDDPFGLHEPERERGSFLDDRRVRLGLATGLVAFVIGAAFVTLSELTLGGSVGGGDRRTTLLGGSKSSAAKDKDKEKDSRPSGEESATPTATPDADADDPEATPTAEPSATASPSPTPTPTPSATPSATAPPGAAPEPTPVP